LWFGKGKAFCEHPFALHRQQPENNAQNVDVAAHGKICAEPMGASMAVTYY